MAFWNSATVLLVVTCSSPLDLLISSFSFLPSPTLSIAPCSSLPPFPVLRWESWSFIFSSSKFRTAASSFRATTEPGHNPGCCCPEPLPSSCVWLPSTAGSHHTAQSGPAWTRRSWLMPGRPSLCQANAAAVLEPSCSEKCWSHILANTYGSGYTQWSSLGLLGVSCVGLSPSADTQNGSWWKLPEWEWFRHATFSRPEHTWHEVKALKPTVPLC